MGALPAKIVVVDEEPQICSVIGCRVVAHGLDGQTTSDPRLAEELPAASRAPRDESDIPELSLRAATFSGPLPCHETLNPCPLCDLGISENQLREECKCLVEP